MGFSRSRSSVPVIITNTGTHHLTAESTMLPTHHAKLVESERPPSHTGGHVKHKARQGSCASRLVDPKKVLGGFSAPCRRQRRRQRRSIAHAACRRHRSAFGPDSLRGPPEFLQQARGHPASRPVLMSSPRIHS